MPNIPELHVGIVRAPIVAAGPYVSAWERPPEYRDVTLRAGRLHLRNVLVNAKISGCEFNGYL